MRKPFKYTASFDSEIVASDENIKESPQILQASLDSLKSLMPADIDLEANIDLLAVAFNAAVVNVFNRNHDGINTDVAKAVYKYFLHKPTNIEHKKEKVVGHIVSSGLSSFGDNQLISEEAIGGEYDPFNIALSAVIYKTVNKDFANLVERSLNKEDSLFNAISASWEIGFNDFVIAVGSKNLKEAEIISDPKHIEEFKGYLKAFDGEGLMDDGTEVYRLVSGDVYPLGIGFTTNPAANVKGLIQLENKKKDEEVVEAEHEEPEKIEIDLSNFLKKIIKSKKNFSHNTKETVISNKDNFNSDINTMEMKDLIKELKETIQASASDKFSEEAVANVIKVVTEAIKDRSESYVAERAEIEKQKEELAQAKTEAEEKVKQMEEQLASTQEKLTQIESEQQAAKASQLFNDRMDSLDSEYELSDEDRKIIASDIKDLDDSEEGFASYQERMAVVYSHKSKKFLEEQEKQFNEKVEAAVQEKISKMSSSEASTEEVTEEVVEESVEEVLDSVEASEDISSNNGESTEKELTLAEKFQQAFSKESITIKY